jgi:hypothetical protein
MLVSMAVLGLIILLVSQMINNAAAVVSNSGKYVDTDTEARVIFNRFGIEMGAMVKRPEVDYSAFKQPASTLPAEPANLQPGNDQLAFYTETTGYGTQLTGANRANVSLVAYQVATDPYSGAPALQRMSQQLGWEPGSAGAWQGIAYLPVTLNQQWGNVFGANYASNFETVGNQVFRMEYTYLLKPSTTGTSRYSTTPWNPALHTSIGGFTDVASIVLTLALLDSRSQSLVHNYTNLTSATLLPDALDSTSDPVYHGDIAPAWNAVVQSPTFANKAGIPQAAAAAVRVYERSFPLDTQP